MYGNVDADLLWLILLAKYLINICYLKIIKSNSFVFHKKDDNGKLELVILVHVDDVFVTGKPETLKKIKEIIKQKLNIQESGEVEKFIEVYYEWIRGAKGLYKNYYGERC